MSEYNPNPNPNLPDRYVPPPPMPVPPPWQPPMPPMMMYPVPVKAKNPGVAAVLSVLCPGLGQFLNGDVGLGIAMFFLAGLAWATLLFLIGFIAVPAVYVWSAVEAYTAAKRWNMAHGIIS